MLSFAYLQFNFWAIAGLDRGYFRDFKAQEKRAARKFCLKTSKNDYSRGGWGCRYPCSLVNTPFYLPKTLFYSQNCPFLRNCYFIFEKCPIVFQNCFLVFQKCLLFILFYFFGVHFFLECFFLLIVPSPHPVESYSLRIFTLLLFCFLLELFIDLILVPSW